MEIKDITGRLHTTPEKFVGEMRGTDLVLWRDDFLNKIPLVLKVTLSKGETGLIKFKTKEQPDPVVAILDHVQKEEFIQGLRETYEAAGKVLRMAKIRPVTQRDLVNLKNSVDWLDKEIGEITRISDESSSSSGV